MFRHFSILHSHLWSHGDCKAFSTFFWRFQHVLHSWKGFTTTFSIWAKVAQYQGQYIKMVAFRNKYIEKLIVIWTIFPSQPAPCQRTIHFVAFYNMIIAFIMFCGFMPTARYDDHFYIFFQSVFFCFSDNVSRCHLEFGRICFKNSLIFGDRCSIPRPVHEDGRSLWIVFSESNNNIELFVPSNLPHVSLQYFLFLLFRAFFYVLGDLRHFNTSHSYFLKRGEAPSTFCVFFYWIWTMVLRFLVFFTNF